MTPVQGPDREERLNHMVLTYEKELLRLCCVYLRDIELARDAVQETFLKAYRRMDKFEGKASEKTWLMRIAINTCKDMLRGGWLRHVDRAADEVTFSIGVFTTGSAYYQTAEALYTFGVDRGETTWHDFTVKKAAPGVALTGTAQTADWTATADLTASAIDVKGTVTLKCPESWLLPLIPGRTPIRWTTFTTGRSILTDGLWTATTWTPASTARSR